MMRDLCVCLPLLLLCIFALPDVYAVGLTGDRLVYQFDYEPGFRASFEYRITTTVNQPIGYSFTAHDGFAEYVRFDPPRFESLQPGESAWFTVYVDIPPTVIPPPGLHTTYLGVIEEAPVATGGAAARTGIETRMLIRVLSEGKELRASVNTPNSEQGAFSLFTLGFENWGKNLIDRVIAEVTVYGENGEALVSGYTLPVQVPGGETSSAQVLLDTVQLSSGVYHVDVKLTWDEGEMPLETTLRIGKQDVGLEGYSYNFQRGSINPFVLDIENKWNRKVDDVLGEIRIHDTVLTTPTISLGSFQRTNLTTYWEPELPAGSYTANVRLHFGGTTKDYTLPIVLEDVVTEQQIATVDSFSSRDIMWVALFGILIIVNVIFWFIFLRRKKEENKSQPRKIKRKK